MVTPEKHPEGSCSAVSCLVGEELIASVGFRDHQFSIELPEPWTKSYASAPHLPEGVAEVIQGAQRRRIQLAVTGMAPDPAYCEPGKRKIIHTKRTLAGFFRQEFSIPPEKTSLLIQALLDGCDLAPFEQYFVEDTGVRDLLVCVNNEVDSCCGRLGPQIYQFLKETVEPKSAGRVRVWKSTHIGGHRFAPTLYEPREMRWWGRLEEKMLENLALRKGKCEDLKAYYRGWAGAPTPFEQVAEREAFFRVGWEWLSFQVETQLVSKTEDEASVRVLYTNAKTGLQGAYEVDVKVSATMETSTSCGSAMTAKAKIYDIVQCVEVKEF